MAKALDITGQRYGRLVAIKKVAKTCHGAKWLCKCDCGNEIITTTGCLRSGNTKSCGCISREKVIERNMTHGKAHQRIYNIYMAMKQRCYYRNSIGYQDYGERGIAICPEWLGEHGFQNFYDWSMNNGYTDNLTLDRIDNNKGYSPNNCRWATRKEQANNKRNNRFIEYNGEAHTLAEWAEITGMYHKTIAYRLDKGYPLEQVFDRRDLRSGNENKQVTTK